MAFFLSWCYVCSVLLRFSSLCFFVEAAALRSIVLRYAGVPIATRVFFFCLLFIYLEVSLFPSIFQLTSFPSGWYFFYLVTTGWIFDISLLLCENSINQSIKGGSYGNKILYRNLDVTQNFPNKISFHSLWVKMLPKNLPKIFRWPEMCPLGKILAQDFQMTAFTKILGRRNISIAPLVSIVKHSKHV